MVHLWLSSLNSPTGIVTRRVRNLLQSTNQIMHDRGMYEYLCLLYHSGRFHMLEFCVQKSPGYHLALGTELLSNDTPILHKVFSMMFD